MSSTQEQLAQALQNLHDAAKRVFVDAHERGETQPEYEEDEEDDMPEDEDGIKWYEDWFELHQELQNAAMVLQSIGRLHRSKD